MKQKFIATFLSLWWVIQPLAPTATAQVTISDESITSLWAEYHLLSPDHDTLESLRLRNKIAQIVFSGSEDFYQIAIRHLNDLARHDRDEIAPGALLELGKTLQNRWEYKYGAEVEKLALRKTNGAALSGLTIGILSLIGMTMAVKRFNLPKVISLLRYALPLLGVGLGQRIAEKSITKTIEHAKIPPAPIQILDFAIEGYSLDDIKDSKSFTLELSRLIAVAAPLAVNLIFLLHSGNKFQMASKLGNVAKISPWAFLAWMFLDKTVSFAIDESAFHRITQARLRVDQAVSLDDEITIYQEATTLTRETILLATQLYAPATQHFIRMQNALLKAQAEATSQQKMNEIQLSYEKKIKKSIDDQPPPEGAQLYRTYWSSETTANERFIVNQFKSGTPAKHARFLLLQVEAYLRSLNQDTLTDLILNLHIVNQRMSFGGGLE